MEKLFDKCKAAIDWDLRTPRNSAVIKFMTWEKWEKMSPSKANEIFRKQHILVLRDPLKDPKPEVFGKVLLKRIAGGSFAIPRTLHGLSSAHSVFNSIDSI